jgi:hypothetical protein
MNAVLMQTATRSIKFASNAPSRLPGRRDSAACGARSQGADRTARLCGGARRRYHSVDRAGRAEIGLAKNDCCGGSP